MTAANALFLLSHLSALTEKCSIYDIPCLSSLTQNYATAFIPGGTGFALEPLDPMYIDTIKADIDGYIFSLSQIEVLGAKHTLIEKVQFNKKEKRIYLKIRIPRLTIYANYTSRGHIRDVLFNGDGKMIFNLHDYENEMTMNYEMIKGKNGKDYIMCNDFLYWFDFGYFEPFLEDINKDSTVKVNELQDFFKIEGRKLWQQYGRSLLDRVNDKIFRMVQRVHLLQPTENILFDF